jgi:hypothetical protein
VGVARDVQYGAMRQQLAPWRLQQLRHCLSNRVFRLRVVWVGVDEALLKQPKCAIPFLADPSLGLGNISKRVLHSRARLTEPFVDSSNQIAEKRQTNALRHARTYDDTTSPARCERINSSGTSGPVS